MRPAKNAYKAKFKRGRKIANDAGMVKNRHSARESTVSRLMAMITGGGPIILRQCKYLVCALDMLYRFTLPASPVVDDKVVDRLLRVELDSTFALLKSLFELHGIERLKECIPEEFVPEVQDSGVDTSDSFDAIMISSHPPIRVTEKPSIYDPEAAESYYANYRMASLGDTEGFCLRVTPCADQRMENGRSVIDKSFQSRGLKIVSRAVSEIHLDQPVLTARLSFLFAYCRLYSEGQKSVLYRAYCWLVCHTFSPKMMTRIIRWEQETFVQDHCMARPIMCLLGTYGNLGDNMLCELDGDEEAQKAIRAFEKWLKRASPGYADPGENSDGDTPASSDWADNDKELDGDY